MHLAGYTPKLIEDTSFNQATIGQYKFPWFWLQAIHRDVHKTILLHEMRTPSLVRQFMSYPKDAVADLGGVPRVPWNPPFGLELVATKRY